MDAITNDELNRRWADREGIRYVQEGKTFDEIAQDYRAAAEEFSDQLVAVRRASREVWEVVERAQDGDPDLAVSTSRYGDAEYALQGTQARLRLIEDAIESHGGYIYPYTDPATIVRPDGTDWAGPRTTPRWEVVSPANRHSRPENPPRQGTTMPMTP